MVRVLVESWVCVRCRAYCTAPDEASPAWNHAIAPGSFVGHAAIVGALKVLNEIERRSTEVMVPQADHDVGRTP